MKKRAEVLFKLFIFLYNLYGFDERTFSTLVQGQCNDFPVVSVVHGCRDRSRVYGEHSRLENSGWRPPRFQESNKNMPPLPTQIPTPWEPLVQAADSNRQTNKQPNKETDRQIDRQTNNYHVSAVRFGGHLQHTLFFL